VTVGIFFSTHQHGSEVYRQRQTEICCDSWGFITGIIGNAVVTISFAEADDKPVVVFRRLSITVAAMNPYRADVFASTAER